MPLEKHVIFGVHITDRIHHVDPVQHLFTEFGCSIRTRLGLHEAQKDFCSPNGLIVLEMVGDDDTHKEFIDKLNAIEGVEAQQMVFDHP
ncbi:hypothetical protein STSP2_00133 [Anaerohalosphaera lusitana]|uniref:Iron-only hydrogenase system regulator n=1 Tax=Anaerohalosphaera lusitana TaxID=1936003 RepID=A0A1U9NGQ9_9BACT|nr:hypothetical protein [Anaerohalosphaera lusitana]AQT66995.1 hypothetical protein STSP2_00133 [Anaerohalosphaera lusitana]